MPVQFLTTEQRANYGRYVTKPTAGDLARYFHLDDADHQLISSKRGKHNQLGFAIQLTTVRYLGRFLDTMSQIPSTVLSTLTKQLGFQDASSLADYHDQRQRLRHIDEISKQYGYRSINSPLVGFRLARWLYTQCWTGTERPILLFDRATTWLLAHKVLLPGASTMERFIAKLRQRVEQRLWKVLSQQITSEQQLKLEALLLVPEGSRRSWFDQLRTGSTQVSGPALVRALDRLERIREQGITLLPMNSIPPSRIATLSQFASRAKITAISRLPKKRKLATLVVILLPFGRHKEDVYTRVKTDNFGDDKNEMV